MNTSVTLSHSILRWIPLLAGIILLCPPLLHAQHDYDIWLFGYGRGLDFRQDPPVPLEDEECQALEATAMICDRFTGELLFSSDGINVYNREGEIMPGGAEIPGGYGTTSQGVLILPLTCGRYALFTVDQSGYYPGPGSPTVGVHYSIVDMTGEGGMGRVVERDIPVLSRANESMTAVMHENGRDYWVILQNWEGGTYYAFPMNVEGELGPPVISAAGPAVRDSTDANLWYPQSIMKSNPAGDRLALTTGYLGTAELFDFDRATGQISNRNVLFGEGLPSGTQWVYGISFSADGRRIYTGANYGPDQGIRQWTDSDDPAAVRASGVEIVRAGIDLPHYFKVRAMQLGPDGRIYVRTDHRNLSVITDPNAAGKACGYVHAAIPYREEDPASLGLPNNIDNVDFFTRPAVETPDGVVVHVAGFTGVIPGDTLDVPISLTGEAGRLQTGAFTLQIQYDTPALEPARTADGTPSVRTGRLTEGWSLTILEDSPGRLVCRLEAPPGGAPLSGGGEILVVTMETVLVLPAEGEPLEFPTPYVTGSIDIPALRCTSIPSGRGPVVFDICGLEELLIELSPEKFALDRISPNPTTASTAIRFSLGLPGPTRLEVTDASGRVVELLVDEYLQSGSRQAVWDASRHGAGIYFVRLQWGGEVWVERVVIE